MKSLKRPRRPPRRTTGFAEHSDKVIELLKNEPMARATIAEKLGISVSHVMAMLDILEARGIVGSKYIDAKSIIYFVMPLEREGD
jgi:DNA-binding transcriptional regulator LsrR (DeoR family)